MKLVHPDIEQQIIINHLGGCEWIIESPELFSRYVMELYAQVEGEEGSFALSENEKEIDISKYLEMIVNPISVNINDKKILNKLYSELLKIAFGEDMYQETLELQSKLQNYFLQLEQLCPYMLEDSAEVDMSAVFKAMGIKLESYANNFFENINQYIKVQAELMGKRIVVLVNVRSYISECQMRQLIETAQYNEINLLFVENSQKVFSGEIQRYIIDCDGCEIL